MTGTVKWFDAKKGYGFVTCDGDGDGEDVFVHHSAIQAKGYRELEAGQTVEFKVVPGKNGPKAEHVVVTSPSS